MSSAGSKSAQVQELAEEFLERYRRGERPSLKEYIAQHLELATEIRQVFPAMALLEHIALADDSLDPSAPAPVEAPRQLGDYRILREIGKGGMGVVYEAEQLSLGRHVALKVLPRQLLLDTRARRRFEREAKAAARLHHTNIVPVFGVGQHDGLPYYVMQFIQGLGLDQVLDELRRLEGARAPTISEQRPSGHDVSAADVARSLLTGAFLESRMLAPAPQPEPSVHEAEAPSTPPSLSSGAAVLPGQGGSGQPAKAKRATYWQSVAHIGIQVASALDYAHKQGIIHRDIKPSNLLLDRAGTVWVADFGLAKADDQPQLTHTGDVFGTLRYLPPEAFVGQTEARSDLYTLGLTLYELLALRPAFPEQDRHKLIKQVTEAEPPRLERLNRAVPHDLATIVHKAMAREPAQRYATAAELAADLERFLAGEPIRARRVGPWQRLLLWARRRPTAAALVLVSGVAVLAVALAVVGVFFTARLQRALGAEAEQRRQVEQQQYYHYLARAAAAWREGNLTGVEQLLDACPVEQRHWEWHFLKRQCHTDLLTVTSDGAGSLGSNGLHWASFSPDGKYFLTRSRTADLRDVRTGTVIRRFPGDGVAVFSPDGKWIASTNENVNEKREKMVWLWDLASAQRVRSFTGHTDTISRLVFSLNGKRLAAAGYGDGNVTVWDVTTGRKTLSIRNQPDPAVQQPFSPGAVNRVAFSPDGSRIALACRDWTAKICDATTGQVERILRGHSWEVFDVAYSPDGKWLASASLDRTVRLWNTRTGEQVRTLRGHASLVECAVFSPDGAWLATASHDGTVRLWEAATGRPLRTYKGHTHGAWAVRFSPDGRRLISTDHDGTVKIWDATADPETVTYRIHTGPTRGLAYRPDGAQLATACCMDGTVKVWDAATGRPVYTLKGPPGLSFSVGFSPDGARLASGHSNGTACVWDMATGREEYRLALRPGSWVESKPSFSPDGVRLACGTFPGSEVKVWEAATGRKTLQFEACAAGNAVIFTPDGHSLLTHGAPDGTMQLWDASTGTWLRDLRGHTRSLWDVAFSRDGTQLASGSFDGTAKLWDTSTGRDRFTLRGHTFFVQSVAFTPDGKRLATVSREGTVKLWDTATGLEVFSLRASTDEGPYLAFSPDGTHLALSCGEGTIKIWDATLFADRVNQP